MREIKFRGKRISDGDWFCGDLLTETDGKLVVQRTFIHLRLSPIEFNQDSLTSGVCLHAVDSKSVGQFTGLKDKNGLEIFEGDILKQEYHKEIGSYDDYETFDGHHIGEVVIIASKGVCLRNPLCYSEETDNTEKSNQYKTIAGYRSVVIGNIYENAELLELAQSAIESNEPLSA